LRAFAECAAFSDPADEDANPIDTKTSTIRFCFPLNLKTIIIETLTLFSKFGRFDETKRFDTEM
jgi:hypothetical protein